MFRTILLCALIAACDLNTSALNADNTAVDTAAQLLLQDEVSPCTPDDTVPSHTVPVPRFAIKVPMLPCATDNPCLVASVDQLTGTCILKTIDQQGAVYCDDHNPCTEDDMCYGDYCLGEIIEGCELDDTYYY